MGNLNGGNINLSGGNNSGNTSNKNIQNSIKNFNSQRTINNSGIVRNSNGSIIARNNGTPLTAVRPKINKFSLSSPSFSSSSSTNFKPRINKVPNHKNINAENRNLQERLNKLAEKI
jgi:hypothetical protein